MKIAVDCRYVGKSGIGRVCEGIIDNLDYAKHDIFLIGKEDLLKKYAQAIIVPDDTDPYSKKGVKKMLLRRCMKKSKRIACVSGFTKSRCEYYFKKYAEKCYVNYIGLAKNILEFAGTHTKSVVSDNTIIFVGNVKKHKGLINLLNAFEKIEDDSFKLKIIGEKDTF